MLPHHTIVITMGKLATANPHGMLSFIKLTLTIILPMLQQIREETLKQAICFSKYIVMSCSNRNLVASIKNYMHFN